MEVEIGKVMYYYEHMDMAILLLSDTLITGDRIHILGMTTDFAQPVAYMEIDHSRVLRAEPGENVAVKVAELVHKDDIIYRIVDEARVIEVQDDLVQERATA